MQQFFIGKKSRKKRNKNLSIFFYFSGNANIKFYYLTFFFQKKQKQKLQAVVPQAIGVAAAAPNFELITELFSASN